MILDEFRIIYSIINNERMPSCKVKTGHLIFCGYAQVINSLSRVMNRLLTIIFYSSNRNHVETECFSQLKKSQSADRMKALKH